MRLAGAGVGFLGVARVAGFLKLPGILPAGRAIRVGVVRLEADRTAGVRPGFGLGVICGTTTKAASAKLGLAWTRTD